MPKLISGRVGVTSFAGLSTTRNQTTSDPDKFLGTGDMEPNLGLPPDNDYLLFGNVDGTRRWDVFAPSGAIDGISVQEQGVTPTGFAGSITKLNFVGNAVDIEQVKETIGGEEIGVATVTINRSTNDIMDSSEFTPITGVTTFKVGAGLSFMSLPGRTGIVSIFSPPGDDLDFSDNRGLLQVTKVGNIRVGFGLSVKEHAVGIASLSVTGEHKNINATGFITAAQGFLGNLTGNVTGNLTGNVTGDLNGNINGDVNGNITGNVTGSLTGSVTGDINSGISTIQQLQAGTVNASGIVTSSAGMRITGGTIEALSGQNKIPSLYPTFNSLPSATNFHGMFAHVHATGKGYFSHANNWYELVNKELSGITGTGAEPYNVGILTAVTVNANINSSGISTTTFLQTTNVNAVGVITATGGFIGDLTGNVNGGISHVTLSDESTDATCFPLFATDATGNQTLKTDSSALLYNAATGRFTANIFSGSGSGLTNIPGGQIVGALSNVDGSALTNVNASKVQMNATNNTAGTHYILFSDSATGNEDVRTDVSLTYNPGTNTLSGISITGNATGLVGDPSISVGDITTKGNILPDVNATRNIGEIGNTFQNIYCVNLFAGDCHFSNKRKGGNDIDGSWGDWTMQEGEETLFLLNNRNGKKYKMNLTEV